MLLDTMIRRLRARQAARLTPDQIAGLVRTFRAKPVPLVLSREVTARAARLFRDNPSGDERIPTLLPPIAIGHEDDHSILASSDLPKAGEIVNLYLRGTVLVADFARVPLSVGKLIKAGVYDKVSVELWPRPPGKFLGQGWMLKRLALLGADVPAVYTLESIPTPDEGMGTVRGVEVFEVGTHNDITYTLDDLKAIVRNYWLNRPAEQKIKAALRRYLGQDATRPLGDGAALAHAEKAPVFVFRSMAKNFTVDPVGRQVHMGAAEIRQALVAAGYLEQDEANGTPDAVCLKMAQWLGIGQNAEEGGVKPGASAPPPAPANKSNADGSPAPAPQPQPAPQPNNQRCADATPPDDKSANHSSLAGMLPMLSVLVKKAVGEAVQPFHDRQKGVVAQLDSQEQRLKEQRQQAVKDGAKAFCDRLRTEKKLTFGMNKDGLVEQILTAAAEVPESFSFADTAGKKKSGGLNAMLTELFGRMPALENWDEVHGGPTGVNSTKEEVAAHEEQILKGSYAKFSSSVKGALTFADYKKSFETMKGMREGITVEEYCGATA